MKTDPNYHFIGLGGIGMSALAFLLLGKGLKVSGSDLFPSLILKELEKRGAQVFLGHKKEQIKKGSVIVYSSAVGDDNPELKEAKRLKLKIIHRSQLLKELILEKKAILIGGTHGKTTVSSLLAFVLEKAGLDPSYAVGGIFNGGGLNGHLGRGDYFVAEADESDGSFLNYQGIGAIVTNVEADHLEYWKSLSRLKKGFVKFLDSISDKNKLFWCLEDPVLKELTKAGLSYGFQKQADLRACQIQHLGSSVRYQVEFQGRRFKNIEISLIGRHNVLNSLAVFGLALSLGVRVEQIKKAFKSFPGIERRLQTIAEKKKILFLEDYGHHPTEVQTVLRTLREAYGKKEIICVFQPHRYSRTRQFFTEFTRSFENADEVIVTDIYAAFEKRLKDKKGNKIKTKDVSGKMLAQAIAKRQKMVFYAAKEELFSFLHGRLKSDALVLFLGAGDISESGREFVRGLL